MRSFLMVLMALAAAPVAALAPCNGGVVFHDLDGDGRRSAAEPALPGVAVSDGEQIVRSNARGEYRLPVISGRTVFVIKPAGWRFPLRANGLPDFWRHLIRDAGPVLKYGGIAPAPLGCRDFALLPDRRPAGELQALVFGDPQPKTAMDVDYYLRDIVADAKARKPPGTALGLTLGDVVNDDLSLYPAMNRATAQLALPWLHAPGNHDLDFDARRDEDSLLSFRSTFGPDTYAWEEHEAAFIVLDDVIYRPGQRPAYIGGLREDQFAFLAAYLPTLPRERLLMLAAHIPFFDPDPAVETFRRADRERLFAMLEDFPHLLLLTAHGHVQRQHVHDARSGWRGPATLHEYNLGAACGAYWSGVADARGIPDARMADGTPNGWALLSATPGGAYRLRWHSAGPEPDEAIALHAPRVLRQGAYPAFGVYANVFMGWADTRVEYRVGDGPWQPMQRVLQPDPGLLAENRRDDEAAALRGYDRSPEAEASTHLWRGTLPTDLPLGEHAVEVRTLDPWRGELTARTQFRLDAAAE